MPRNGLTLRTKERIEYFKHPQHRRQFLENLFLKFQLRHLDDWLSIPKNRVFHEGGKYLLRDYASMEELLSSEYANYPWNFHNKKLFFSKYENLRVLEYQRVFMNRLFQKFGFESLRDWLTISKRKIILSGGNQLLQSYKFNFRKLLSTVYPNFPWKFSEIKEFKTHKYFQEKENQVSFMNFLYLKFGLKSLNDWQYVPKTRIIHNGGHNLLLYYSYDIKKLLRSLYPTFPFEFDVLKLDPVSYFSKKENQLAFMNNLYQQLNLKSLDDWNDVRKIVVSQNQGKVLLTHYYNNDMKKLLNTLYPNHVWPLTREFYVQARKIFYQKYAIQQKKDWYRIPVKFEITNIYELLKFFYPEEHWREELFLSRLKKARQRLLYSCIQEIYPQFSRYEDYRHPHINPKRCNTVVMELDIFLPSLNLALEYQGEQHYNDIPSAFSNLELYQTRDKTKEFLALHKDIHLYSIPFWWDTHPSSLFVTIQQMYKYF